MITKRFVHEFVDHSSEGSLSFIDECPPSARIKLEIDDEGSFWFSANHAGWLHFAKIAAELGLGDYEDGFHFHKDENFRWSTECQSLLSRWITQSPRSDELHALR